MNGPSPLSPGERELIFAYAAGTAGSAYVYVAHAAAAEAWGIEEGHIDKLLDDLDAAPVEPRLKPLLAFVRKLILTPGDGIVGARAVAAQHLHTLRQATRCHLYGDLLRHGGRRYRLAPVLDHIGRSAGEEVGKGTGSAIY